MINTLVLAYAGASLPLLILIAAGNTPLGQVLTTQMLTQEIVRTVVGTMGLIAAVPITTALAATAARRTPDKAARPDERVRRRRRRASFAAEVRTSGWLDARDEPDAT